MFLSAHLIKNSFYCVTKKAEKSVWFPSLFFFMQDAVIKSCMRGTTLKGFWPWTWPPPPQRVYPLCISQAFFVHVKKTQPKKKLKIWKKTHGFSKKNSRYRNLTVIALHREQKKLKKTKKNSELSKKNSENFQKNSRYRDLTVIKSRKSAQK